MKKNYNVIVIIALLALLSSCENPNVPEEPGKEKASMAEKTTSYVYQPVKEYEHYIETHGVILGFSRESIIEKWADQKVEFMVEMTEDGKDPVMAKYMPLKFFATPGASGLFLYWSAMENGKEIFLSQQGGVIQKIDSLPAEPAVPAEEFTGNVGQYSVNYKAEPYQDWKCVDNGKGHILNHQSSTFAYPLGDNRAVLYVPKDETLWVIYTMPNGLPATDKSLSLNQDMTIF